MIIFAVLGVLINFLAAYFTKDGDSLNQKSVNLHMLEDVLGWGIVLLGAIIMKYTDIKIIDPILSIGVAIFIFINSLKNLKEIIDLFLEKTPSNIDMEELREHLLKIKGVIDIHHIHVRSIDGFNNYLTMHVVVEDNYKKIKHQLKEELQEHGIGHSTIEFEDKNEKCDFEECEIKKISHSHHHHKHNH
jgi:cobalt-zinc-cadmium efflux system protein